MPPLDPVPAAASTPVSSAQQAIELGRPLVLIAVFLIAARVLGPWAVPLALVCVFAVAILVHDLLHNALHLSRRWSEIALAVFALFLWLRVRVGRWTPAASSVLFHELHHRAPRLPVSLLALHRAEIEARPASPCEELPRP